MSLRVADLFPAAERPKLGHRWLAHVEDAGVDAIMFRCPRCQWSSDWIKWTMTFTEANRGIPCPVCNARNEEGA